MNNSLIAGAKYEFNFSGIDFSKGFRIEQINYSKKIGGTSSNLIEGITDKPEISSKEEFIEFMVMLDIISSIAESEVNKFIGNSSMDFNVDDKLEEQSNISFIISVDVNEEEVYYEILSDGQRPVQLGDDFAQEYTHTNNVKIEGVSGTNIKVIIDNNISLQSDLTKETIPSDTYVGDIVSGININNTDAIGNGITDLVKFLNSKLDSFGIWVNTNGTITLTKGQEYSNIIVKIY